MAGYRDVNSASQTIRRNVQAIDISQGGKDALEATMIAMAAAGKMNEFACIMQSLEKTNTSADLGAVTAQLGELITTLKNQNTTTEIRNEAKTVTISQEEYDKLLSR